LTGFGHGTTLNGLCGDGTAIIVMLSNEAHQMFGRVCDGAENFVLTTHINPDGDAIGSEYSLGRYLASRGKRVRIINHDPTSESLRFITDDALPHHCYDPGEHDAVLAEADRIVLVDNSAPDRLGRMEPVMVSLAERVFCIDHHPMRGAPWAETIVDVESCATAAMIYDLITGAGWKPDLAAAEAIYVGLATDTGFFRFDSTNARAHEVAAELLAAGVSPARVFQRIHERNSVAFTRLLGHALSKLEVVPDGTQAWVTLRRELIDRLDVDDEDTSEIATSLLALAGVMIVMLFRELADGRIKVSLRSKGTLDVHRLAIEFGGGGHRNASGIVMPGSLEQVVATITERTARLIDSGKTDR